MSAPVMVLRFGRVGPGITVTLWLLIPVVESAPRKEEAVGIEVKLVDEIVWGKKFSSL